MEVRVINDNYRLIAEQLINSEPELSYIKESSVQITYLESNQPKKADKDKVVLGECEKVADKNRWAITSDFTITLYEPNLYGLSDEQIKIVLFHELLHIGIQWGDNGECYYVRKHDLEDFKVIIDKYDTNWSEIALQK